MLCNKLFTLLLVILISDYCELFLLNSGWYKVSKNGKRQPIQYVPQLSPDIIPGTVTFLKVGGILTTLHVGALRNLVNLKVLLIPSVAMSDILPGAFENVPQLYKINLKDNRLQRIRRGVFNFLNISELYLYQNKIETIEEGAFDNMSKLYKIKLNSNKINTWNGNWFRNCPTLRAIVVKRNQIEELTEGAFATISSMIPVAKQYELKIFLSKNKISYIHPDSFRGLYKIGYLFLDRNNITTLDGNTFASVQEINRLSLTKNNLTKIPSDLVANGLSIRKLDLSGNRRLQCIPFEVAKAVDNIRLINVDKLNCSCVTELKNYTRVNGLDGLC